MDALEVGPDLSRPPASAAAVLPAIEVYVPLEGLIDVEMESRRLDKEAARLEKALKGLGAKLGNKGFLRNAPAHIVAQEREREGEYRQTLARVRENMASLRT